MIVLNLISSGGFYGAENVLIELVSELKKNKGIYPIIGVFENSLSPHLELVDECIKRQLPYVILKCKGRFDIKAIFRLRHFLKSQKIKIIHSHGYKSNVYSFLSTIGLKIPLLSTCHNWIENSRKQKLYGALDRIILRKFTAVISVSSEVKKQIEDSGVKKQRNLIIRNGININRFNVNKKKKLRCELNINDDTIVIGTVGRISEEKGHEYLLKAAKRIQKNYSNIVLLIVGEGILKDILIKKYKSSSIHFIGKRNDIPEVLNCMDIFVLPSLSEGLPMSLLEAMSAKLPVIASSVGAIPELIDNNKNGRLVRPGSEKDIEQALICLIESKQKRADLGKRGFETVRTKYSSERMAYDYLQVYTSVAKYKKKMDKIKTLSRYK